MKKNLLYCLGAVAIIFLLLNLDFAEIFLSIKTVPLYLLFISLTLQIITMVLISIQWKTMVNLIDKDCKLADILKMNMKGNVVDAITPGVKVGGELARLYDIKVRLGLNTSDGAVVVGLQKTASILSFYSLTLLSLIWFYFNIGQTDLHHMLIFSTIVIIFGIGFIVIILAFLNPKPIESLLLKIAIKENTKDKLKNLFQRYVISLKKFKKKKKKFFLQILLSIFIWILFAFKMYLILIGLNIKLNMLSIASITYLSYIIGMIPLLPGSVGSFETSMTYLLSMKGVAIEKGIAIAIIFRFVTFWFEFFISLFFLISYKLISKIIKRNKYARKPL
ncbi:lysylphosphatidylglycerol synthase transmembrane domain-containing protein [Clostridiisalibacter paucivorans]|uniref:lysylphosphatidylglycerol synthase transmembrane domain-containing protein n=1 Tax=Clostridiisalibacter paucivorans TaxID=408753 RepID=UPI00047D20B5|nr:lysylphosphatidylglycerol synthase transmembrane domain-containing protein [Clostridiisalibacter paucivorans]